MFTGVLLGVAAGALWGLIYIAPLLLPQYNPVLVALGRFVAFGIVSLPFLWILRKDIKKFSHSEIFDAFKLPLVGNLVFYCLLTMCIRLAGAPLAGMFMAVIPVLVAIVSNCRYAREGRAVPWRNVLPPLAIIFAGLVLANWSEFARIAESSANGSLNFWIGAALGSAAVAAWTWFSIENGEWLLRHPQHSANAWTALQGVTILPTAGALFALLAWPVGLMDTSASFLGETPLYFLGVVFMVGLLCSWIAMICWNQMSQRLPSALGGQLIVFESIFAVIYALIYRGEMPTWTMIVGFTILLIGVRGSLKAFREPLDKTRMPRPASAVRLQTVQAFENKLAINRSRKASPAS